MKNSHRLKVLPSQNKVLFIYLFKGVTKLSPGYYSGSMHLFRYLNDITNSRYGQKHHHLNASLTKSHIIVDRGQSW